MKIADDPVIHPNKKGYLSFATSGPDTRTTQVFINTVDNEFLDSQGFAPFAEVLGGMDDVKKINDEYGETPKQFLIQDQDDIYLKANFPKLSEIGTVELTTEEEINAFEQLQF